MEDVLIVSGLLGAIMIVLTVMLADILRVISWQIDRITRMVEHMEHYRVPKPPVIQADTTPTWQALHDWEKEQLKKRVA